MTSDPDSWIQASAKTLAETLASKNQDYAPGGEFSTFEKTEELTGVRVMQIINAQIGIKMTRLQSLWNEHEARVMNEPIVDTYMDLAGYAVIAHAYLTANSAPPIEPEYRSPLNVTPLRPGQWDPAG